MGAGGRAFESRRPDQRNKPFICNAGLRAGLDARGIAKLTIQRISSYPFNPWGHADRKLTQDYKWGGMLAITALLKNVQTSIALRLAMRRTDCNRALVVVLAALKMNWEREILAGEDHRTQLCQTTNQPVFQVPKTYTKQIAAWLHR